MTALASSRRILPWATIRADTRNAKTCARARPMVVPQMIPNARRWPSDAFSATAVNAARRQTAT
jgi:hypothetical protein